MWGKLQQTPKYEFLNLVLWKIVASAKETGTGCNSAFKKNNIQPNGG
jgi:hypothetical protein